MTDMDWFPVSPDDDLHKNGVFLCVFAWMCIENGLFCTSERSSC